MGKAIQVLLPDPYNETVRVQSRSFFATLMDMIQWMKNCLRMFYIVLPYDYGIEEDGDRILLEAWPFFVLFIVLENIILLVQRKSTIRFNDSVTSISHGIFYESSRLLTRGVENCIYATIHHNYKIMDLCWNNALTWYMAAVIVDFFYYWVHRASHEIHILWAQHQVHHSSEDYNLTVGLRHPFFHNWCGFVIYLPMAFFIPPTQFLVHHQVSLLYQFWTHTSIIKNLGPLELIFNTPRHHRAHHGSNKKFLDKNYGGFLIIWDRMFGTFIDYEPTETITYGLVMQPKTFNPLYLQTYIGMIIKVKREMCTTLKKITSVVYLLALKERKSEKRNVYHIKKDYLFYNQQVYKKFKRLPGFSHKLQSLIKGPSWLPGRPWTGCNFEKIDVHERDPYNPVLHPLIKMYLCVHFGFCLYYFYWMVTLSEVSSLAALYAYCLYVLFSLTVFGMFFDGSSRVVIFETIRCCVSCLLSYHINMQPEFLFCMQIIFSLSASWWIYKGLREN